MKKTLISIVTVSYNAVSTIEQTILSVINQTYPHIEYIIIDGGSTDGTVDIIKKYADKIAYWVSEPDKGIYDAMNKGIKVATGEWINFMNAGDYFANNNVLLKVFSQKYDTKIKVLYGDYIAKNETESVINKSKNLSVLYKEMPFCHQSAFLKNENILYDTNFKIAADYKLFVFLYKNHGCNSFVNLNEVISIFDANGISSKNTELLRKEYNVLYKQFNRYYYCYDCLKLIMKKLLTWKFLL